jgi:hypothetical protein
VSSCWTPTSDTSSCCASPGLTFQEAGAEHTVVLDAVSSATELEGESDFA